VLDAPVGPDEPLRELFGRHRLSPAQRRIARYLLDHAADAVFLTTTDIAERVGVSQPSVTRFATALGFTGFPEFRDRMRAALADGGRPEDAVDHTGDLQRLVATEIRNLEAVRDGLADEERMRAVAAELAASRPLPVVGVRTGAPLAGLFTYFAAKVLPDVRLLDRGGSALTDGLIRAADYGATWLLAFALPRYPSELHDPLTWARERGMRIALVTDQPIGALADLADELLVAPVGAQFAFDSQAAPTVLSMVLLHAMLEALPTREQQRLDEFEATAARRGIFLAD
jgi:DNA-binding MurR/RpiR family transcriptional regulator